MEPIIEVKNLSKRYTISHKYKTYVALRDVMGYLVRDPFKFFKRKIKKPNKGTDEDFYALNDINFSVNPGEVIGVIGPNGAGKSTLLKVLSRITPPTKGEVILRGRVASLLEIGTGFHPELTGRENIYFNGGILGMSRKEINSKFDDIVSFSGVEQFIDTPIKRYSSGMQVRLAFSVAAFMEPDILLVDEVLAVGDAEFQKRSLGKMEDVSKKGRTVIFVSHNMAAVIRLCQRGLLLKGGKVVDTGDMPSIVSKYMEMSQQAEEIKIDNERYTNEAGRLINIREINEEGKTLQSFDIRKPIGILMEYEVFKPGTRTAGNIQLTNTLGVMLFNSPEDILKKSKHKSPGIYKTICWLPGNFLAEGLFVVRVQIGWEVEGSFYETDYPDAISFNVHDALEGGSVRENAMDFFPGVVRPKLDWTTEKI